MREPALMIAADTLGLFGGFQMNHFYEEIEGWFDFENLYRRAVERMPRDARMVEVGVYRGRSLFFLTVEALNSGKDIHIYGVDRFNWPTGAFDDIQRVRREHGLDLQITLIARHSTAAAREYFGHASLDFVFIDADHTYEAVKEDILAWRPKMKPGGIMAGHDLSNPEFPGVRKAVQECFGTYEIMPGSQNIESWWVEMR